MNLDKAIEILGDNFSFTAMDTHSVIQTLDIPKDSRILDVGTGMGSLAITLAINGYTVTTGEPEDDETIYAKQDWLSNAQKVNVDHKITFQPFNAIATPFEDGFFHAVFSLGTLHHIQTADREAVLRELVRITKPAATICFFEPTQKAVDMIRATDPSHPDAADPIDHIHDQSLSHEKIKGNNFDAFIIRKNLA